MRWRGLVVLVVSVIRRVCRFGSGVVAGWSGGRGMVIEDCDSRRGLTSPPDHWDFLTVVWRKSQSSCRKDVPDPMRPGFWGGE